MYFIITEEFGGSQIFKTFVSLECTLLIEMLFRTLNCIQEQRVFKIVKYPIIPIVIWDALYVSSNQIYSPATVVENLKLTDFNTDDVTLGDNIIDRFENNEMFDRMMDSSDN